MKRQLLALATASAFFVSGQAQAAVEICETPNCTPARTNVLFDKTDSAATVTGDAKDTVVLFTSPFGELLTAPSNGAARVSAVDQVLNGITFALESGFSFATANFNVKTLNSDIGAGLIDISYILSNGQTGSEQFSITSGQNKFGIFGAPDGTGFLSVTITADPNTAGFRDLRQVRLGGIAPVSVVPEPGTWAVMILGIGLVGMSLRRRQKATVKYAF